MLQCGHLDKKRKNSSFQSFQCTLHTNKDICEYYSAVLHAGLNCSLENPLIVFTSCFLVAMSLSVKLNFDENYMVKENGKEKTFFCFCNSMLCHTTISFNYNEKLIKRRRLIMCQHSSSGRVDEKLIRISLLDLSTLIHFLFYSMYCVYIVQRRHNNTKYICNNNNNNIYFNFFFFYFCFTFDLFDWYFYLDFGSRA